jgi:hypothetical protein
MLGVSIHLKPNRKLMKVQKSVAWDAHRPYKTIPDQKHFVKKTMS